MQFIVTPAEGAAADGTAGSSNSRGVPQSRRAMRTASTPLRTQHAGVRAREAIPTMQTHAFDDDLLSVAEVRPRANSAGTASAQWVPTRSSARWAATHTHLLANLSHLRCEVADWEEAAFARAKVAEQALADSKAHEAAVQASAAEAERTKQFFHNQFAVNAVKDIRLGGDGTHILPRSSPPQAKSDRRGTWTAGSATPVDFSAVAAPELPRRASLTLRPSSGGKQHRSREQDAAALKELQSVMNNDVDEKWMDTILDLASPRKPRTRSHGHAQPQAVPTDLASPSRNNAAQRPVSKVYSALALEHRRALRRHPKIAKWLEKFWRVFELQREEEALEAKAQGKQLSPTSATGAAPATGGSAPTLSGRELLASRGISKSEFVAFYQLLHKALSGDDVSLTHSALHDFERMVGARPRMAASEFGDVLFELIDLWCLTHIPEDYVSICKALYCRVTARGPCSSVGGAVRTSWVTHSDIGLGPMFKVQPLITPLLEEDRRASKRALKTRREKQAQYERIMAAQKDEVTVGSDEEPTVANVSSGEEEDDDSEADYQSDEEGDTVARPPPLTDENGQLLSLRAPEVVHAGNRLRARERQFVGEAILALNEAVSSFHDDSALALAHAKASGSGEEATQAPFSVHSNQGLGYASRRKTIGLKWSIVSELMEGEIEKAQKHRENADRRRRENEKAAAATLARVAPLDLASGGTEKPEIGRRTSLKLDGMMLGIHGRSPRREPNGGVGGAAPRSPRSPSSSGSGSARSGHARSRGSGSWGSDSFMRSPGGVARHLYASFDAGDSDLEDEDDARLAREERKQTVGHSWPSLHRVLALRQRTRGIESQWLGVVSEAVARKKRADAITARRREIKYFKALKAEAIKQARIAGVALKDTLEEADTPLLEAIASMSFIRGGEKAKERIAALLEQRDAEREQEAHERARQLRELDHKRALLLESKRKKFAAGPVTADHKVGSSAAGGHDLAPIMRHNGSVAATGPPSNRRVSWRDENASVADRETLAELRNLAHPAPAQADIKRASGATVAAGRDDRDREKARDLTRAQRKAIVDAVVARLTRGALCTNPLHNHNYGTRVPVGPPKFGITEVGSKYPLNDLDHAGDWAVECVFADELSPLAAAASAAAAAAAAPVAPITIAPAPVTGPWTLAHEAHRVANEILESGASLPSRLARHATTNQPQKGGALEEALSSLAQPSALAAPPLHSSFSLHGDHVQLTPKAHLEPVNKVREAQPPSGAAATGARRSNKSSLASLRGDVTSEDERARALASIRAAHERERSGSVPARHGSFSARSTSPVGGPVIPAAIQVPGKPHQSPKQHRRQRSRSAVASPSRTLGGLMFDVPPPVEHLRPPVQPQSRQASDDSTTGPQQGLHSRAALRSYLSADSADTRVHLSSTAEPSRVHLPSVTTGAATKGKAPTVLPALSAGGSGPNSTVHSRVASRTNSTTTSRSSSPAMSGIAVSSGMGGLRVAVKYPSGGLVPGPRSAGSAPLDTMVSGSPSFVPRSITSFHPHAHAHHPGGSPAFRPTNQLFASAYVGPPALNLAHTPAPPGPASAPVGGPHLHGLGPSHHSPPLSTTSLSGSVGRRSTPVFGPSSGSSSASAGTPTPAYRLAHGVNPLKPTPPTDESSSKFWDPFA